MSAVTEKPELLPLGSDQETMISAFVKFGPTHFKIVTGLASAATKQIKMSGQTKQCEKLYHLVPQIHLLFNYRCFVPAYDIFV